jgi:hypothetical protein
MDVGRIDARSRALSAAGGIRPGVFTPGGKVRQYIFRFAAVRRPFTGVLDVVALAFRGKRVGQGNCESSFSKKMCVTTSGIALGRRKRAGNFRPIGPAVLLHGEASDRNQGDKKVKNENRHSTNERIAPLVNQQERGNYSREKVP